MQIRSFGDMYRAEFQELTSAGKQLVDSWSANAGTASHPPFKNGLVHHRAQTGSIDLHSGVGTPLILGMSRMDEYRPKGGGMKDAAPGERTDD